MDPMSQSFQQLSSQRCKSSVFVQTEETKQMEDGSVGRLVEFTARLESDGSWYYKSKYRSATTGGTKVRVRRVT